MSFLDGFPSSSLVEMVEARVRQSTHNRIRNLSVAQVEGRYVVAGQVASQHMKQLALHGALEAALWRPVRRRDYRPHDPPPAARRRLRQARLPLSPRPVSTIVKPSGSAGRGKSRSAGDRRGTVA